MTGEIRITRQAGFLWQCPFSPRELVVVLRAMCRACGLEGLSLDVTLTDDAGISRINQKFLGCIGPTNILSFPSATGDAHGGASLVLSLDTLERECFLYGQNALEHTLRLLAHGMAHVSGYDHGEAMNNLQDAAVAAAWESFA